MRIMALDYGDKRVGVALSDELGWTAQPMETIDRKSDRQVVDRVRELVSSYQVEMVVVGLPRNMNGTIGPRGEACRAFAEQIESTLQLPVRLWDERLTTVAAERTLLEADVGRSKRRKVIDKMAAQWILQGFLDSRQ